MGSTVQESNSIIADCLMEGLIMLVSLVKVTTPMISSLRSNVR